MSYHVPVLLHESIQGLNINPEGIYVDVTFGGEGIRRRYFRNSQPGNCSLLTRMRTLSRISPKMKILFFVTVISGFCETF